MPAEFVNVKGNPYMSDPDTDVELSINTAHIRYVTFRRSKATGWKGAAIELVDGDYIDVSDQDSITKLRRLLST